MAVKYIFVTGGVVSGLGKGITAASLGRLLKARGYKGHISYLYESHTRFFREISVHFRHGCLNPDERLLDRCKCNHT